VPLALRCEVTTCIEYYWVTGTSLSEEPGKIEVSVAEQILLELLAWSVVNQLTDIQAGPLHVMILTMWGLEKRLAPCESTGQMKGTRTDQCSSLFRTTIHLRVLLRPES